MIIDLSIHCAGDILEVSQRARHTIQVRILFLHHYLHDISVRLGHIHDMRKLYHLLLLLIFDKSVIMLLRRPFTKSRFLLSHLITFL